MTTAGNAVGKIDAVIHRRRRKFRGKNKAVVGIYRGMFLQSVVGFVILDNPVGVQITRELKVIPVLVYLSLRGLSFFSLFLDLLIADRVTGRLHQAGINGYAFIDGQALSGKL